MNVKMKFTETTLSTVHQSMEFIQISLSCTMSVNHSHEQIPTTDVQCTDTPKVLVSNSVSVYGYFQYYLHTRISNI